MTPRTPTRTANSEVPQLMARTMRYPWLLLKCWLTDTARTSGTVFWICSQSALTSFSLVAGETRISMTLIFLGFR